MLKWIVIALAPIVIILLVEEVVQFFWKRYIRGPKVKKEGKLKDRLVRTYQNMVISMKEFKFPEKIRKSKMVSIMMESKFISFFKKQRKDPSH